MGAPGNSSFNENQKNLSILKTPDLKSKQKRTNQTEMINTLDGTTPPFKRQKLLQNFGLATPSPIVQRAHISEKELKDISVAIHLWAQRKMRD